MAASKENLPRLKEQIEAINAQFAAHGIPRRSRLPGPATRSIRCARHPRVAAFDSPAAARADIHRKATASPTNRAAIIAVVPSAGDARRVWTIENLKRGRQAKDGRSRSCSFTATDVEHPWSTRRRNASR
jgi:hypothetical protein